MSKKQFETLAIRHQLDRTQHREHSAPIFPTSSFVFDDVEQARALFAGEEEGMVYSRYGNPNNDELVTKLAQLEGMESGIATASGMAAMFTSMAAFLNAGDHVVATRSLFGSTHQIITGIFPRWGIDHTYIDLDQPEQWEAALRPNTKMIFVETPSNPALGIVDLKLLGQLAHSHGVLLNVDNCFATPYLQTPKDFGAHIVTHSATKFIDGQGRVLGGAVLTSQEHTQTLEKLSRHSGPAMSPFHGWLLSKSLETLAVRMDRHCANALELARRLETESEVEFVRYPFLPSHPQHELAKKQMKQGGGIVSFQLKGGQGRAVRFMDSLQMLSLSSNLGDSRTIATFPAYTTHAKLTDEQRAQVGITEGLIRISVGLEHIDDLWADIAQAVAGSH